MTPTPYPWWYVFLMILQTTAFLAAAFGAIWYARDNSKIRAMMWNALQSQTPRLRVEPLRSIGQEPRNGISCPLDLHLSVCNVGIEKAIDVETSISQSWDNPVIYSFPELEPGKKNAKDHGWDCDIKKFAHHASEGHTPRVDIHIKYRDNRGKEYPPVHETQEYDCSTERWLPDAKTV